MADNRGRWLIEQCGESRTSEIRSDGCFNGRQREADSQSGGKSKVACTVKNIVSLFFKSHTIVAEIRRFLGNEDFFADAHII